MAKSTIKLIAISFLFIINSLKDLLVFAIVLGLTTEKSMIKIPIAITNINLNKPFTISPWCSNI